MKKIKIDRSTKILCIIMGIMCALFIGCACDALYVHPYQIKQQEIQEEQKKQPQLYDEYNAIACSYKILEPSIMYSGKFNVLLDSIKVAKDQITPKVDVEDPKILSNEVTELDPIITTIHTIKSGDSYWKIANKYYGWGGYCDALCAYNGLTTTTILHPGDTILIPSVNDPKFSNMIRGLTGEQLTNDTIVYTYDDSYTHGTRTRPAVNINIPTGDNMKNFTEEVDTSSYRYIGNYHLTGYAPTCAHCCGGSTSGIGASGVTMVPGYSIAMSKDIPFGTTVYIEGYGYYVVEDRGGGIGPGRIDIACPSHDSAYATIDKMYDVPVYIVD